MVRDARLRDAKGGLLTMRSCLLGPLLTELKRYAKQADIPLDVPFAELSLEHQRQVIEGDGKWSGVRGFFAHLERKKYKLHVRVFLSRYRGYSMCSACSGNRLPTWLTIGTDSRPDTRST